MSGCTRERFFSATNFPSSARSASSVPFRLFFLRKERMADMVLEVAVSSEGMFEPPGPTAPGSAFTTTFSGPWL
jgi:hypothetical protein